MSRMERTERATGLSFALPVADACYQLIAGKPGTQWLPNRHSQDARGAP
ncbi:hypothetical protein [Pengzhenrongella sp.]